MLTTLWQWISRSSVDPNKIALSLKAGIPFLIVFMGWGELNDALKPALNEVVDITLNTAAYAVQVVTGVMTLFGIVRKIIVTVSNKRA